MAIRLCAIRRRFNVHAHVFLQAAFLQQHNKLDELVDPRLGSQYDKEEVERIVKIALICTNATPSARPTMSEVVQMIDGNMTVPDKLPEGSPYTNDVRFKSLQGFQDERRRVSSSGSQNQDSRIDPVSFAYTSDYDEITRNSVSQA